MAKFCLTKNTIQKFKKALKDREIDPIKLAGMTSLERREFLSKYVGKESAVQANSLFESKLLLKNQKAGYINWAKKVSGITSQVKRDMISRIEKLDRVLDPKEEEQFLQDLASTRLGVEVTQEEAKTISDLSKKITELKAKANKEGIFPNETQRFEYGASKVAIEEYINDLKLKAKDSGVVEFVKESPGIFKSIQSSLDNSFFGRQGIKVLYNNPIVWTRNFIKSWGDIGRELKGKDAMLSIKSDIYSRPNALNGKYEAGGYGLDVLNEEAYPSSLPSKIPLLGRLFKASESAYNGVALRIRADLADKFIAQAEKNGVNTLNKDEAKPIGRLIGSLTGRGSLGKVEPLAREANVLFYSIKFLKSNIDTLIAIPKYLAKKVTGQYKGKGEEFAGKKAATSTLRIIVTIASILTIAKKLDPDSVDEDPTSTNFGKIKIFGLWTDITGGMGALVRLAARLALGRSKSSTGTITEFKTGFGGRTALDELEDFTEGKLSPIAGLLRDKLKGELFGGEKFTLANIAKNLGVPLPIQSAEQILKNPESEFALGSMILEALGFSTSTYIQPNKQTKSIPTDKKISNTDFIEMVSVYAQALGTDPETAFNRIFSGQKIMQVSDGGIIVVNRQSITDSQQFKKDWIKKHGGKIEDIKEVKLDHVVPNKMGGEELKDNWAIVSSSIWSNNTKIETTLIRAVKNGKIKLKDAQDLIKKYKRVGKDSQGNIMENPDKKIGLDILNKFK